MVKATSQIWDHHRDTHCGGCSRAWRNQGPCKVQSSPSNSPNTGHDNNSTADSVLPISFSRRHLAPWPWWTAVQSVADGLRLSIRWEGHIESYIRFWLWTRVKLWHGYLIMFYMKVLSQQNDEPLHHPHWIWRELMLFNSRKNGLVYLTLLLLQIFLVTTKSLT